MPVNKVFVHGHQNASLRVYREGGSTVQCAHYAVKQLASDNCGPQDFLKQQILHNNTSSAHDDVKTHNNNKQKGAIVVLKYTNAIIQGTN